MTRRVEKFGMEPWWPRWISIDWGYQHPAAVHWFCQSDSGTTFTYREFVKEHVAPRDLARKIISLTGTSAERDKIQSVFLSPDAWQNREGRDTIADQINKTLHEEGFKTCRRADTDRVGGAMLMYQMLRDGTWVIGEHCDNIIETLPMMIRDEKNIEDVMKLDGDDAYDSCRYGLKSRYNPKREPMDSRIRKRLEGIVDPTEAMMRHNQLIAKEKMDSKLIRRRSKRYLRSRTRTRRGKSRKRSPAPSAEKDE